MLVLIRFVRSCIKKTLVDGENVFKGHIQVTGNCPCEYISEKVTFLTPDMHTYVCVSWVGDVSFMKNFAYILNGQSPVVQWYRIIGSGYPMRFFSIPLNS